MGYMLLQDFLHYFFQQTGSNSEHSVGRHWFHVNSLLSLFFSIPSDKEVATEPSQQNMSLII